MSFFWRRQWHPTPVLLPGKSHGWGSLVGCSPWGCEESDTTERLPFPFHFHFHALKKEMATHSSVLAWRIPGLISFRMDCLDLLAVQGVAKSRTRLSDFPFTFTFLHWRRKWKPTPVFLLGESQGRGNLVGCHLWGHTESDTTEAT